jgi:FKBP-type peptidyl-prolyl cis-trans isomerase
MRPGGKRTLLVPKALAPKGVALPDGVPLEYQIELLEVLQGYF